MVLAVRTGVSSPLVDWDDDRVIETAFEVLGDESSRGRRREVTGE